MRIIGLTGPTGAGKSTLSVPAQQLGIATIDCDAIARKVTMAGQPALFALKEVFGDDILSADGSLLRPVLAQKAFASPVATQKLNQTIFPFITKEINAQIAALQHAGVQTVLLDAPTLYESGANALCQSVIAVLAPAEVRLSRIIARDGITKEAALQRMQAGKPDEFYKNRADYILQSNGNVEAFMNQAKAVLQQICKGE